MKRRVGQGDQLSHSASKRCLKQLWRTVGGAPGRAEGVGGCSKGVPPGRCPRHEKQMGRARGSNELRPI